MTRSDIAAKIRKLRALAESEARIHNEAAAETIRQHAADLAGKHGITPDEIENAREDESIVDEEHSAWKEILAYAVAHSRGIRSVVTLARKIAFVGPARPRENAARLYRDLVREALPKGNGVSSFLFHVRGNYGQASQRWNAYYANGFAVAIAYRLGAMDVLAEEGKEAEADYGDLPPPSEDNPADLAAFGYGLRHGQCVFVPIWKPRREVEGDLSRKRIAAYSTLTEAVLTRKQ